MCVHIYVHINHISKQKGDDKYEGVGSFTYKGNCARDKLNPRKTNHFLLIFADVSLRICWSFSWPMELRYLSCLAKEYFH